MLALASLVCALVAAIVSPVAPSFGQAMVGGWQAGPGAAGDNTYAGVIDSPASGASFDVTGRIGLSGWFVDTTAQGWAGADDLQVFLGSMDSGTLLAHGNVGLNRLDVAAALGNPYWAASGWTASIDAGKLPPGQNTLSVYVHAPAKGWWSIQVTVNVGQGNGTATGELLAPAPAAQGPLPRVSVTSPREGDFVSTHSRSFVITGTASDATQGARGIDWVELWLNGEANTEHAIILGDADLNADGTWSLPFDPAQYAPINSNLYVYAHSAVNGKRSLVVVHFYITNRPAAQAVGTPT